MNIILYKPNPLGPARKESMAYHKDVEDVQVRGRGILCFTQPKEDPTKGKEVVITSMPFKIIAELHEVDSIVYVP